MGRSLPTTNTTTATTTMILVIAIVISASGERATSGGIFSHISKICWCGMEGCDPREWDISWSWKVQVKMPWSSTFFGVY